VAQPGRVDADEQLTRARVGELELEHLHGPRRGEGPRTVVGEQHGGAGPHASPFERRTATLDGRSADGRTPTQD